MRKFSKLFSLILTICLTALSLWGCQNSDAPEVNESSLEAPSSEVSAKSEYKDIAGELSLDMNSDSAKLEVTVSSFVDGDTTYFNVPEELSETGAVKIRYLAVDTPETTGKIEEYGKKASNFTRGKLEKATSVIIESDTSTWDFDSTGTRYLGWVWYRENENEPYRNLNVEILQNGLAFGSSSANNRYGETCMEALNQAKTQKLNVFSGEKDPDFFYGDAIELTLKELRANIEDYNGKKVAFTGIVTKRSGNGVYVENYDAETDMFNGIYVYYGFTLADEGLDILSVGNEVRIVGTVSYYEAGQVYQVTGPSYRAMKPDDPNNIQKISEGNKASFTPTEPDTFLNGKVKVELGEEVKEMPYAEMAMGSTVEMKDLHVDKIATTLNEESSSFGAMTFDCTCQGLPVTVRTGVIKDENGETAVASTYEGKDIDVKGVVDFYNGTYQIKVLSTKDITIK